MDNFSAGRNASSSFAPIVFWVTTSTGVKWNVTQDGVRSPPQTPNPCSSLHYNNKSMDKIFLTNWPKWNNSNCRLIPTLCPWEKLKHIFPILFNLFMVTDDGKITKTVRLIRFVLVLPTQLFKMVKKLPDDTKTCSCIYFPSSTSFSIMVKRSLE